MKQSISLLLLTILAAPPALAQAQAKGPGLMDMLIMPAGIILIMYFFMIRPQQKKAKEHTLMLAGLKKGDEVITTGGIIGRVRTVSDTFVTIDIANNVSLKVVKQHVAAQTKAPEPVAAKKTVKA